MFSVLIRTKAGDLLFPSHAGWSDSVPVWVTEPLWYLIDVFLAFLFPRSQVLLIEKIRSQPSFLELLIWVENFPEEGLYARISIQKWLDWIASPCSVTV